MAGRAVHGNTPFSCTIISQVTDNLWQGGCEDGLILPSNIKHVVSLYKWEHYKVKHELLSSLTVEMYDDLRGPNRRQVKALAEWINVCRASGPTLVHCQAGLNRSGLLTAAALILGDGLTPDEAIDLLREQRSPAVLCNPSFAQWLRNEFA